MTDERPVVRVGIPPLVKYDGDRQTTLSIITEIGNLNLMVPYFIRLPLIPKRSFIKSVSETFDKFFVESFTESLIQTGNRVIK